MCWVVAHRLRPVGWLQETLSLVAPLGLIVIPAAGLGVMVVVSVVMVVILME